MARPRRSGDTREALIEHGLTQFLEHGYHGTGINGVLNAVKVPKGSFYNYFASKEAFVAEVIDRYARKLFEAWDGMFATWDGPVVEGLQAAFGFMIEMQAGCGFTQGCLVGNLAGEIAGSSAACRDAMRSALEGWRERLVELLTKAQAEGSVRADRSAPDLADLLLDAWEGAQLRAKVEQSRAPLERVVRFLLKDYLRPAARRLPGMIRDIG